MTETQLWQEFTRTKSKTARDRLILTYAPLVKYVAGRLGSGLPAHVDEADLVSYGLLGLIDAIERYDPGRDIKFETYAITRIRGAIIDELRALDWVPRSVRARARAIERAIGHCPASALATAMPPNASVMAVNSTASGTRRAYCAARYRRDERRGSRGYNPRPNRGA